MIVVTTPTGNIGRHVVRHLLDAGEALRVIARDPSRLPQDLRERVEVVEGSHGDAAVVDLAFEGADAVFWLCPPTPSPTPADATVDFARPGAEAMRRHGIPHIVAVTTLGRDTPWQERAGIATGSIHMVDLLRTTGRRCEGWRCRRSWTTPCGRLARSGRAGCQDRSRLIKSFRTLQPAIPAPLLPGC